MMDELVPGMKDLQKPLLKTLENLWPILEEDPDIIEKQMPTLKEITNAVVEERHISDKEFAKWGNSLLHSGGSHLRKKIKAFKNSPIEELIEKIQALNFDNVEDFLEADQLEIFKGVVAWSNGMLMLMSELGEISKLQDDNDLGWFGGIMDTFS